MAIYVKTIRKPDSMHKKGLVPVCALTGRAGGSVEVIWISLCENLCAQEGNILAAGVAQLVIPSQSGRSI